MYQAKDWNRIFWDYEVELGRLVQAGERLYQILKFNKEGELPTVMNIFAEQNGLVYDISSNNAVNQGEFVLGIVE